MRIEVTYRSIDPNWNVVYTYHTVDHALKSLSRLYKFCNQGKREDKVWSLVIKSEEISYTTRNITYEEMKNDIEMTGILVEDTKEDLKIILAEEESAVSYTPSVEVDAISLEAPREVEKKEIDTQTNNWQEKLEWSDVSWHGPTESGSEWVNFEDKAALPRIQTLPEFKEETYKFIDSECSSAQVSETDEESSSKSSNETDQLIKDFSNVKSSIVRFKLPPTPPLKKRVLKRPLTIEIPEFVPLPPPPPLPPYPDTDTGSETEVELEIPQRADLPDSPESINSPKSSDSEGSYELVNA